MKHLVLAKEKCKGLEKADLLVIVFLAYWFIEWI